MVFMVTANFPANFMMLGQLIKDKEFLIQCESLFMTTPQQGDLANYESFVPL